MAGKFNLELKVGIFAFIGLIILTLAVFSISEVYIFRPGYFIKLSFNFASGIDVGAPVRVAGVEAGEIKEVTMVYDQDEGKAKAMLLVWLEEGVMIPQDSVAFVSVLGLIGEAYLEIIPGDDYTNIVGPGEVLQGRDPVSCETVMELVRNVATKLNGILDSVDDLVNEQTRADFKTAVSNTRSFTDNLDQTLDKQTKENVKDAIQNIKDLSENVRVISERLERGEGKLGAWLKPTKRDIRRREKEKQAQEQDF